MIIASQGKTHGFADVLLVSTKTTSSATQSQDAICCHALTEGPAAIGKMKGNAIKALQVNSNTRAGAFFLIESGVAEFTTAILPSLFLHALELKNSADPPSPQISIL